MRVSMTTISRAAAAYKERASQTPRMIPNPRVRCPCCANIVACLPAPWTIEPCQSCRRPLTLSRMARRRQHYRLCNVIDVAGSVYGIVTMVLVLSFVLSDMDARAFAKAVTILMFVIGSLLLIDGALSMRTAIDRTWRITSHGLVARALGGAKSMAGLFAIALVIVGLAL